MNPKLERIIRAAMGRAFFGDSKDPAELKNLVDSLLIAIDDTEGVTRYQTAEEADIGMAHAIKQEMQDFAATQKKPTISLTGSFNDAMDKAGFH